MPLLLILSLFILGIAGIYGFVLSWRDCRELPAKNYDAERQVEDTDRRDY